jgi:DNA polymerase/3'-5' exonuclease PolX
MENSRIAEVFDEIGDLLELKGGNPFRVRSYRNAARSIRGLSRRLEDMLDEGEDLESLPDIGSSISGKIAEIIAVGTDAHSSSDLALMDYGVAVARRGWCSAENILNTLNLTELRKRLGG